MGPDKKTETADGDWRRTELQGFYCKTSEKQEVKRLLLYTDFKNLE